MDAERIDSSSDMRVAEPAHEPALPAMPVWFDELDTGLSMQAHFAVSGNLRDLYPAYEDGGIAFRTFEQMVWRIAEAKGFAALCIYDSDAGLRVHPECPDRIVTRLMGAGVEVGAFAETPEAFAKLHRTLTSLQDLPLVLIVDYAPALFGGDMALMSQALVEADKTARQVMLGDALDRDPPRLPSPTLWLVERPGDLPAWFVAGNDALRELSVELPNLEDRYAYARTLVGHFTDGETLDGAELASFLEQFALEAEGMKLAGMKSVARIAERHGLASAEITEAIRSHRLGTRRNPWKSPVMRSRMMRAREIFTRRIKGQHHAIDKTLDILMRSIVGLSGAQTGSRYNRPRGVMFFVGPTGVGKTELAKAVTELLFGDENACHRFDMSEFMEENSINRLIGAPPGYPGHERGGELVNAMHKRPFSVVLFDEVEKAHPRVLDAFLQILDEGRLTDSRGSTAYFSEALIIFTSNIGLIGKNHTQNMGMNILPSDDFAELEAKLIDAVRQHFRNELNRPELMNRIGQNVIAFEFIGGTVAAEIFSAIVGRVLDVVRAEHGVEIEIEPQAMDDLRSLCMADWFEGGRGIANRIETHFINPLSREIFRHQPRERMTIVSAKEADSTTTLECRL